MLLGELPNVYVYAANNPSESIVAKRRGYGTIISHNVPPYGRAGLYKQLAALRELLQEYREAMPQAAGQRQQQGQGQEGPFAEAIRSSAAWPLAGPIIDALVQSGLQVRASWRGPTNVPAKGKACTVRQRRMPGLVGHEAIQARTAAACHNTQMPRAAAFGAHGMEEMCGMLYATPVRVCSSPLSVGCCSA